MHDLNDLNDSVFHTAPAKFVTFGDASISEVSAKPAGFDVSEGQSALPKLVRLSVLNPNQGTLQKSKDVLNSRPWKPPSLVLAT